MFLEITVLNNLPIVAQSFSKCFVVAHIVIIISFRQSGYHKPSEKPELQTMYHFKTFATVQGVYSYEGSLVS